LPGFVLAWLVSDLVGELYLWLHAFRELRRREFTGLMKASVVRAVRANEGVVRYAFASNLNATLNQAIAPLLSLLVGGMLGASAAGLYKTAQVVVETVSTPAELAMRSLFPETARLLPEHPAEFWRLIWRTAALACLFGLAFGGIVMVAGPALLTAAMGAEYGGLGTVLRILAFGFMPLVGAYPLETALLAIGGAGRLLAVRAGSVALVVGITVCAGEKLGLVGVALASTAGAFAAFAGLACVLLAGRKTTGGEAA
jgi:O-antigen/teichoic acid export membrane protein